MNLKSQISIQAPKETVWEKITNIENSQNTISGIEDIEILEKPDQGIIGLKWRETRIMFGKTATEVMWITDAVENEYYTTRAESHGAIYETELRLTEQADKTLLEMSFEGRPQTFMAKLFSFLMGFMFKGATKKALQKDLEDIKTAAERA